MFLACSDNLATTTSPLFTFCFTLPGSHSSVVTQVRFIPSDCHFTSLLHSPWALIKTLMTLMKTHSLIPRPCRPGNEARKSCRMFQFLNLAHTKLLQTLLVLGSICRHLAVWEVVHSPPHSAAQKLWSTFRRERYPVLVPAAWGDEDNNSCLFRRLKVKSSVRGRVMLTSLDLEVMKITGQ